MTFVTHCCRLALFFAALNAHAADLYRIAGTVTNAQSGSPLPNSHVVILAPGSTTAIASMVTSNDGKFAFEVREGKYNLHAGTRDVTQTYGLSAPDSTTGMAVIAGPEQATANLVFRWFPPAAISGKILDEYGEPAENALVQIVRSHVVAGRRSTVTAGWERANDRGEYRIAVPGGTYYLLVTGAPWYSSATSERSEAYTPMFYPNTPDSTRANAIHLNPGEDIRADFTLHTVRGAIVSVKYEGPQNMTGVISLIADGIGGTDAYQKQERLMGAPGVSLLSGVPPGRYLVRLGGTVGTSNFVAQRSIDVNGSDMEIEMTLRPAPVVSGTVKLKKPGARPRGSILASVIRMDNGRVQSTAVKPDGSFFFPSAAPGAYRITLRGIDGYFASEIRAVTKTEIRDGLVELREGDAVILAIEASDEIGRVKGFAMDGDRPAAGALVVLVQATDSVNRVSRGFLTDSDASFDIEHVPAGQYLLFATADPSLEYTNLEAVKPYLQNAKPIRIEPQAVYSERVPLAVNLKTAASKSH